MFSLPNLKSIFQNLNDLIFILDENGVFLEYHSRDTDDLVVPSEMFISKHVSDILPPETTEKVINAINRLKTGESEHENFEYTLNIRNQVSWYDASITSFTDARNNEFRVLASIRDITNIVRDRILLERVFSSSSDGLMVAESMRNEEGEITDFRWVLTNEAASKISKISLDSYIGKGMLESSSINEAADLFVEYKKVVETGIPYIVELEFELNNELKWYYIDANKLSDGFVVRFRDVTRHKEEELKAKKHITTQKLFISQAPSSIAMLDNRLNYIACSSRYLEEYGLSGQDIIGKNYYSLFPNISDKWRELNRQCLAGKIRKSEREHFIKPDGSEQWLKWEGRPWFDDKGEIGGILMYSEDISEAERSKEKLSELNIELQVANDMKNRLFSVLAHDLRSPLSSIYTMLGILKDDQEAISKAEFGSYIQMVYQTASNMQELLDDLLLWSKEQIGASQFKAESIVLPDILNRILKEQEQNLRKKELSVTHNVSDTPVMFDEGSLKVIIRNFLTNAIKFSKQGDQIEITGDKEGSMYQFIVQDQGVGMDNDTYQRIMSNTNIESSWGTAGEKGSGIGLSICRSFIQKGNGRFLLESSEGKGTKIGMLIPLSS